MRRLKAKVHSVYLGSAGSLSKDASDALEAELDGLKGDRHRGYTRECWAGDKQKEGTIRRNERMWSAVSIEELKAISEAMDLTEPLTAALLGANICLEGLENLSDLACGTILKFPSGAELMVEEYNPPCLDMGIKISKTHKTRSGTPIKDTAFSKAAQYSRGVVGVVDVTGKIISGDEVTIKLVEG